MHRFRLVAAGAALTALAVAAPTASAERFVAVDRKNRLYTFSDSKPGTFKRATLRGLAAGERILGLDVRPANRQLFAVTNLRRLYTVSRSKRTATPVAMTAFTPALTGSSFGFDFNPTVDRIRLVTDARQDLRLNPNNGAVGAVDGDLAFKAGDPGAGIAPRVEGSAYTNTVSGATTTTLYGIETRRDALALQAPPNDGVLSTVGPLNVNVAGPVGFDISARDGRAYMLARRAGSKPHRLYRVSLRTGAARQLGAIGKAPTLVALAALSAPRAR